jgi:hypothetical protein
MLNFLLTRNNKGVTDQLFLSVWLDAAGRRNRMRQFEKLLRAFPFSQREEQPQSTISILAVDDSEPPLLERPLNGPIDVQEVLQMFADYKGDDVAYELESWWDLWTGEEGEWNLRPTRVLLSCFGPEFDNGTSEDPTAQEDLRIDLGVDVHFLPGDDVGNARFIQSNVKSVLRLVHELDTTLFVARRQLQTESGENFAIRLEQALRARPN